MAWIDLVSIVDSSFDFSRNFVALDWLEDSNQPSLVAIIERLMTGS